MLCIPRAQTQVVILDIYTRVCCPNCFICTVTIFLHEQKRIRTGKGDIIMGTSYKHIIQVKYTSTVAMQFS